MLTDDVYIFLFFCEILLHKYHIDGKHVRVYHSRICQQASFLAMAISKYAYPSGKPEIIPGFCGIRVARSLVFCVVLCRSLFVLLSFFDLQ
jgi:hypothetical protein